MLLGFLFLLIVLRRDILHRRAMEIKDVYTLVGRKYGRLGLSGERQGKLENQSDTGFHLPSLLEY